MKKILIIAGAVILIAVTGRAFWAYQQVKNNEGTIVNSTEMVTGTTSGATQENVVTQTVTPVDVISAKPSVAIDTKGWKAYSDPEYKFSVQYPSAMEFLYTRAWHPISQHLQFLPIANIIDNQMRTNSSFTMNNVSVIQTRDNSIAADYCTNLGKFFTEFNNKMTLLNRSTTSINSVQFTLSNFSLNDSKGLERHYTTLHNGICYDINTKSEFIDSCAGQCKTPPSLDYYSTMLNKLDTVAQTFRFN